MIENFKKLRNIKKFFIYSKNETFHEIFDENFVRIKLNKIDKKNKKQIESIVLENLQKFFFVNYFYFFIKLKLRNFRNKILVNKSIHIIY